MNRTTTKQNLVAKILSTCILSLLFYGTAFSQALTGTKTIPGSYSSIANALTDLNANGVGTGGVTFNIAAGYTETITAKLLLTATGTSTDSIIFQKSGAGANPLITAYVGTATATSASPDGIWAIAGSDYVRIDGIDLLDPTTNTTAATSMEYGYGIFKTSATNGAQNNIIKNCTITLNQVNNTLWTVGHIGSTGIVMHNTTHAAAATNITVTSAAGRSAFNKFYSNTIKNCNAGISLVGYAASSPFTLADTLNDIGGNSAATGNSIINFGGAASAANGATGIYSINEWGINCSYNTLNNNDGTGVNHVNTLRGIYLNSATSAAGNCNYNYVTLKAGGTTQTHYGIDVEFGATATTNIVNINYNTIENCAYTTATSGSFYGIYAATTAATVNINNNIVRNINISASTGSLYGINWTSPTNLSIQNNQVYSLSRSGAGTTGGIYSASGSTNEVISNNTVYDLTNTNTSSTSSTIYGIYQNTTTGVKEFKNNTVYNLSAVGSTATGNTIIGISVLRATTLDISSNTVYGISGTGSTVTGISLPAAVAGTYTAYKNKVYDISSTIAAPLISGIAIAGSTASTTFNIYNNLIGDLRAPTASGADMIRGINITNSSSTSTINVFYNTVNISATSTGTNFGTSGIFHTTSATATTATLNLRNNIIVNTSVPNGTGLTVAYRRSNSTLTNYATTSNNNLFYTDLTGNRTVFYDGTNKDSTISLFKARMLTRDQNSVYENPTWVSTNGSNTNFLNIATSTPTQIESKAANITSPAITVDFNGNIRQGNVGYPTQVNGGGTAPDMGAWEFDGQPLDLSPPTISYTNLTNIGSLANRTLTATIIDLQSGVDSINAPRVYFKKSTDANVFGGNTAADNGWKYTSATKLGNDFTATIDYSIINGGIVTVNDTIQYFFVAQDLVATPNLSASPSPGFLGSNVSLITAAPTTPNRYTIIGAPLAGTYTIGTTGDFTTITGAINNLNNRGISGPVTFELIDANYSTNETFPIVIEQIVGASSTSKITIKPSSGNTVIVTGSSTSSILKLNGADFVTIDGSNSGTTTRNLTITNTSTASGTAVIWNSSLGLGLGAIRNTFKNCILLNGSNAVANYGVFVGGTTIGTSGSDNDFVTVQNDTIALAATAVYAIGTASVNAGGLDSLIISDNVMRYDGTVSCIGIQAGNALNASINKNNINLQTSSTGVVGISLETGFLSSTITKNNIVRANTTNTGGYGGRGITVGTGDANSNITIANNTVSGINGSNWNAFGNSSTFGIGIGMIGSSTTITTTAGGINLYFNTVNIYGSMGSGSATATTTALYIGSAASNLNIRNNVFVNTQTATSTTQSNYAIYCATSSAVFTSLNYNNYYVFNSFNAGSAKIGYLGSNQASLANWKTATSLETNSISVDPIFASNTLLIPSIGSPVIGAGILIAGYTVDIIDSIRSNPPTIGAYEKAVDVSGPIITYTNLSNINQLTNRTLTGFATITDGSTVNVGSNKPRLYFRKASDANALGTYPADNNSSFNGWKYVETSNTTSPFNFTIDYSLLLGGTGVNINDTILYFVVAQDALGNVNSNPSAGFTATSVGTITAAPTTPNGYLIVDVPMAGPYTVGVSGNYPNLNSAVFALNTRGAQGDINFDIISNIIEPATVVIPQWTETGAGNYKLRITPTGTDTIFANSANSGAIVLFGADRVTIDGRIGGTGNNLTIVNTNTAATSVGILVASAGTSLGCVNDSIVNVNILTGTNTATSIGIQAQGDNNNNLVIKNNVIKRAQIGINVFTTNYPAGANTGLNISGNIIGDVLNTLNVNRGGINISNSPQATITQNRIYNVNSTTSSGNYAIQIGSNASKSIITANRIDTVTQASSSGWGAYGINVTGSDTLTIANNIVTRMAIYNYDATSTTFNPFGIRITAGSGHRIYYNTVNLFGSSVGGGTTGTLSAALLITGGTNLDIRNNIFVNSYVGVTGSQSFAIYNTATTPFAIINNNNYYATGTYGVLGYFTANRTTLAAWKTATAQDVSSISTNPSFTSNTDVNINSGATANQMESAGATLAVTTDFNGDPRPKTIPTSFGGNTAPDMGAIEFDGQPIDLIPPTITYTNLTNTSLLTNRSLTATITDLQSGIDSIGNSPRVYFKKSTDANVFGGNTAGDNGWKYTSATKSGNNFTATIDYAIINGGSVAVNDTVQYFVVAQDLATVPNVIANPLTGFAGSNVAIITAAPTTPNYYVIGGTPLAGNYTVGAGGNFTTLTDAVNNLNLRGISANVTFQLTDATYTTPAETFPLTINQISGANATSRLTIRPSSGNTVTIAGSSTSSIIKLNGADFVTIDGSNNGTTTRDLTITNTSTVAGTAVIWNSSLGLGLGAIRNTFKNCTLFNGSNSVSNYGVFVGGATIGSSGADNDFVTVQNDTISSAAIAIYAVGTASVNVGGLDSLIISDNGMIYDGTASGIGIQVGNALNASINKNTISYQTSTTTVAGISLETGFLSSTVTRNNIVKVNTTNTGGYAGRGITVGTGDANSNITIANNFVSGVNGSNWNAFGNSSTIGIGIGMVGSSSTLTTVAGGINLYFNTVNIYGSIGTGSTTAITTALYVGSAASNLNINNNVFVNTQTATSTTQSNYAIYSAAANTAFNSINYNNYYVFNSFNAGSAKIGFLGADQAALSSWRIASGKDVNSINDSTRFVSSSDLHLTSTSIGNFNMKAAPIAGINTDIDNELRSAPFHYMGADEVPSSPLPVTLTSLTANVKENNVLVSWTTASEVNNKGFEVERSIDGTDFATIAFVKGAGNSSNVNSYSKLDLNAFNATASNTIYYRLKQVDFDGKYTYSQIVKVYKNLEAFSSVAIYPNPFVSQITVSFNAATQSTAVIEILDIQGKVVATKTANTVNGTNTVEVNNTDNLQAGIYFARLTLNGESQVIKLVKTK